jgi:hypothetical protein
MVCQRYPITFAQLARRGARCGPDGRWCCDGGGISAKDGEEQVALIGKVAEGWEEAVRFEAVDGVGRHGVEEVGVCGCGEGGGVGILEGRGVFESVVGEGSERGG